MKNEKLGDLVLPAQFQTRITYTRGVVEIEISVRSGRLHVDRLVVEPSGNEPLRTTELRDLPLDEIIIAAAQQVSSSRGTARGVFLLEDPEASPPTEEISKQRRKRLTDEHLLRVAEVYREHPGAPTEAVRQAFFLTRPTAARHVAEVRRRGFLRPTTKGRKGEPS